MVLACLKMLVWRPHVLAECACNAKLCKQKSQLQHVLNLWQEFSIICRFFDLAKYILHLGTDCIFFYEQDFLAPASLSLQSM